MNPQSEESKVLEKKKRKKKKKEVNHKTKSRVKGPKPRAPYLVLPLGLGSEDRHAIHQRRLGSHLSYPCWTWEDTRGAEQLKT